MRPPFPIPRAMAESFGAQAQPADAERRGDSPLTEVVDIGLDVADAVLTGTAETVAPVAEASVSVATGAVDLIAGAGEFLSSAAEGLGDVASAALDLLSGL